MKKKILFVYPSVYTEDGTVRRFRLAGIPSRTLPYLAAMTLERYDVRIVDEAVERVDTSADADLVAITGMLPHVPRAIDLARAFRQKGIPTILGGTGAYSLRDHLTDSGALDSIVVGEVEGMWNGILDDFELNRLRPMYESSGPQSLERLPWARFDLLKLDRYIRSFVDRRLPMLPLETSRGCPNNCRYCLVTRFFGRRMRYRPIGEVVDEIKALGARHILFTDDNIAINPTRAAELFKALKPLGLKWFGQFESRIVRNPDLLRLAAEAGCITAFVGVESLDPENLGAMGKSQDVIGIEQIVKGFRDAHIILLASLIFGLDRDTPASIEHTVGQMVRHGVDTVYPWMLTPIPGTPVYEDYWSDNRLLHENYSLYDGVHAVIQPKQMTSKELERSYWEGLRHFYSLPAGLTRAVRAKGRRFSELLYNLHVHRQVRRRLHPFSGIPA